MSNLETCDLNLDGMSGDELRKKIKELSGIILELKKRNDLLCRSNAEQLTLSPINKILIDHIPQRIVIKDRNSIYLACNEHFAADVGIPREQIVGKDDFAFFPSAPRTH